ncbi:MAG: putative DNA-binding protein [Tardiphaga sp.]|nr:putative DNA-binding protein [Tardiphaga sp.]
MGALHLPTATVGFFDSATGAAPTMSSREIAELVGSRHDKVKQSIERLAERGVITLPPLGETSFTDAIGKVQHTTEYRIGKRDSYVIVAQLSPEFTARLVDRWQALEAELAKARPLDAVALLNDPATLQRLLLDNVGKVVTLQERVAELEPKAAFHDAMVSTINARKVKVIAKEIGTGEKRLFAWLRWVGRFGADKLPVQRYLDQGHFIVEPDHWRDPQGFEHAYSRILVTGKGLAAIQRDFSEEVAVRALRYEREVQRGRAPADVLRGMAEELRSDT